MKVLVLHRYFWPQAYPYAQMLKYIVETISNKHTVSVLSSDTADIHEKKMRDAWSTENNINLQTLPLGSEKRASILKKALNALYFGSWVFYKLSVSKVDVVMVATTPPVVVAMLVRWVSYFRKFKYIYHCQDIHPEVMLLGGNIKKGFKYNLLLSIDRKNINSAWKVITLSEDMKQTIITRECKSSHINIINNFIFESGDENILKNTKKSKLSFLFAGSLGRMQNLDVLIKALIPLRHRDDVTFTFMGDGFMFNELTNIKNENKLHNVQLVGQRSLKEAVMAMRSADIGIVSIGAKISSVAYPSKTIMYLGNGLPVLALVEEETELYKFINTNKVGKAISPASIELITESINELIDELKESPIDKEYVKSIADANFSKHIILPKFLDLYT